MLSFRIFGIPTRIHWMFWVVMALLGGIGGSDMKTRDYQAVLIFIGAGFVSILVHELGHALTARKYGASPEILLYGMGGLASYPGTGLITRKQRLEIIAAGPGFGLALGVVAWLLWRFVLPVESAGFQLRVLFRSLIFINIIWSLVNLLPVLPLDGGQFVATWMGGGNPRLRGQIGAGVAGAVAAYGLLNQQIFLALMFGFLAYSNYQISVGRRVKFF